MDARHEISLTVNGKPARMHCEARALLSDALREQLGMRGVRVGCEHGLCGACTVNVDGETARSCLMFAVQADGAEITTVEGLANSDTGELHPLQESFARHHALQCGFCTSGMLLTARELLDTNATPTEDEIRSSLSGNLCRCTGYASIVAAVKAVADSNTAERERYSPTSSTGRGGAETGMRRNQ